MLTSIRTALKRMFETSNQKQVREAKEWMDNRQMDIDLVTGEKRVWRDTNMITFTDLVKI